MTELDDDLPGTSVLARVLGFAVRRWLLTPGLTAACAGLMLLATVTEVFVPLFAGRMIDAVAHGARQQAWHAFAAVVALGAAMVILRYAGWRAIIPLSLRIMAGVTQDAFARVQRLSAEWHAGNLSGSTVRQITRGLWALDTLDDTLLLSLLPSFSVLHGYLRDIGQQVQSLQRSANELEEVVDLLAEPVGVADRPGAGPIRVTDGAIRYERVRFTYAGTAAPLFSDLSVSISAGQRVGLVGRSGSGKTSFVKLLQRLYDVDAGRIEVDGQDIAGGTQASLRRQIAIVPQEPVLFHRSLAENIAYARPDASRAEIEAAARLANAHGFIERLPCGYDTPVGERGVKLSGGERQRVAIARAFLADAPILILDEATSSLDAESEAAVQDAMVRLMVGRTTLVIAHRLSTVRALDRILVFDAGRIVEDGTHDDLLGAEAGIYRRLFERQVGAAEPELAPQ